MAKKIKLPLGVSLQSHDQKQYLKSKFPFLKNTYRPLEKKEINSKEVFKEFFGDIEYVDGYLKAIYYYQN